MADARDDEDGDPFIPEKEPGDRAVVIRYNRDAAGAVPGSRYLAGQTFPIASAAIARAAHPNATVLRYLTDEGHDGVDFKPSRDASLIRDDERIAREEAKTAEREAAKAERERERKAATKAAASGPSRDGDAKGTDGDAKGKG